MGKGLFQVHLWSRKTESWTRVIITNDILRVNLRPASALGQLTPPGAQSLSSVRLSLMPWTTAHWALLFMGFCYGFPKQEDWVGGHFLQRTFQPRNQTHSSPTASSLSLSHQGSPQDTERSTNTTTGTFRHLCCESVLVFSRNGRPKSRPFWLPLWVWNSLHWR